MRGRSLATVASRGASMPGKPNIMSRTGFSARPASEIEGLNGVLEVLELVSKGNMDEVESFLCEESVDPVPVSWPVPQGSMPWQEANKVHITKARPRVPSTDGHPASNAQPCRSHSHAACRPDADQRTPRRAAACGAAHAAGAASGAGRRLEEAGRGALGRPGAGRGGAPAAGAAWGRGMPRGEPGGHL